MGLRIEKTDVNRFYLVRNDTELINFGCLEENAELETGQPYLETFFTEEELKKRVNKLMNDESYYDNSKLKDI